MSQTITADVSVFESRRSLAFVAVVITALLMVWGTGAASADVGYTVSKTLGWDTTEGTLWGGAVGSLLGGGAGAVIGAYTSVGVATVPAAKGGFAVGGTIGSA